MAFFPGYSHVSAYHTPWNAYSAHPVGFSAPVAPFGCWPAPVAAAPSSSTRAAAPASSGGVSKATGGITLANHPEAFGYLMQHVGEDDLMLEMRLRAQDDDKPYMIGSPDEAFFLGWLARLIGAKRVVEVGVFRGTTTLALARAVGDAGTVHALELNRAFTEPYMGAWEAAGVAPRIDFVEGDARASMAALTERFAGQVDLVFIDADKTGYDTYYEHALTLLRPGGIVAIDNTLWDGAPMAPAETHNDSTAAIAALNEKVRADDRVDRVMIGIADGVYLCRKL